MRRAKRKHNLASKGTEYGDQAEFAGMGKSTELGNTAQGARSSGKGTFLPSPLYFSCADFGPS